MSKAWRRPAPILLLALVTCATPPGDRRFELTVELVEGGRPVPGLIRVRDARGRAIPLPPLVPRGLGLAAEHPSLEWYVLPGRAELQLPREPLSIEAFRGLETEISRVALGPGDWNRAFLQIPLHVFLNAAGRGWRGANTHLHLKEISRAEADRYLRQVPAADGLDVLFVSYLERAGADKAYVSNQYSEEELRELGRASGVLFGNGEEHRHNFGGFEEGYGHVMFLDLRKLIRPVSIGRGIMKEGVDAPPLQAGIDEAKAQGASILWCHNSFGLEDIPNWLGGRPHAQNIFDGDPESHGSYRDTFYRYLNSGLRVPFSTGTDWFIYDFSRAYAAVPTLATPRDWLRSLEAGRTFITNGPFLDFQVENKAVGEVLGLAEPRSVRVKAGAVGRVDFRLLEVVRNGEVIGTASSKPREGHFEASIDAEFRLDGPCWLALRIPPPPTKEQPAADVPRSELGGPLFAHTSPVYVEIGGRAVFQEGVAKGLLEEMKQSKEKILKNGVFADEHQRDHVLSVYALAISALEKKLAK
jgi:hypothetical protein